MNPYALHYPALFVAVVGGGTVALATIQPSVGLFVRPVTYVCAAATLALFLRMLFDPRCHRGIGAASREMQGVQPFRTKWPKLNDARWGLFGSRAGDKSLLWVRAVLFCEFVAAMLFGRERPELTLLAAASFGIAMMLSILHIRLKASGTDPSVP